MHHIWHTYTLGQSKPFWRGYPILKVKVKSSSKVKMGYLMTIIFACWHKAPNLAHIYFGPKQNILERGMDVVAILVGVFYCLVHQYPDLDLWVGFGAGKHFRYYHINSICLELGEDKCQALPFFHAFTGCDVTSQFNGKGKKSA